MKRLSLGDLAIYRCLDDTDTEMKHYEGCVVRVAELIVEEYMYYDYFVLFPDNRTLEVTDDELEPVFTF